jgi:hypothetical protein
VNSTRPAPSPIEIARETLRSLAAEAARAHEEGRIDARNRACKRHDDLALRLLRGDIRGPE